MKYSKIEIFQMIKNNQISKTEALELLKELKQNSFNDEFPVSEGQRALWVIYKLAPDNYAYNTPIAYSIKRDININALHKALIKLVERHPALRTIVYSENNTIIQKVLDDSELSFEQIDMTGILNEELNTFLMEYSRKPFVIEKGPLMRVYLFTRDEGDYILLFNFHHIIFDGISTQVFMRDLMEFYIAENTNTPCTLNPLTTTYKDFVDWQSNMLKSKKGDDLADYWNKKLINKLNPLSLPVKEETSKTTPGYQGITYSVEIEESIVTSLKNFCSHEQISPFIVMLSVYKVLLHKYTHENSINICTPVAGRPESRFDDIIGYFMNLVIIQTNILPDMDFNLFLKQVQDNVLEALEYSNYPLIKLIEKSRGTENSINRDVLNIAFYFQNWIADSFRITDFDDQKVYEENSFIKGLINDIHQEGEFDLTLEIHETEKNLTLHFKFNNELFKSSIIERMAGHYITILKQISEGSDNKISDLSLLTNSEKELILNTWNNTQHNYPEEKTFYHLFLDHCKNNPDSQAVIFQDKSFTYKELSQYASLISHKLIKKGLKKGMHVGIMVERSLELLPYLLGIVNAGGVYVPLDPDYPAERLSFMINDAQLGMILLHGDSDYDFINNNITVIDVDKELPYEQIMKDTNSIDDNLLHAGEIGLDDPIYIIYTSGSTGKPKGVKIPHRGLVNFLYSMSDKPGCNSDDHLLALTTICFDIAGLELYLPLITGGKVEIVPDAIVKDGIKLKKWIEKSNATIIQATPATWKMLFAANWHNNKQLKILSGGEPLTQSLADSLIKTGNEVWNLYGPTETTIWSTAAKIEKGEKITVGTPIHNTEIYILDGDLNPVPVGITGELYIGGHGLAIEYYNRMDITKEKFIPHPFKEGDFYIYNTGDSARYLENGSIEVLGRKDHQVKIRGFRIELSEIEIVLNKLEEIKDSVVVVRNDVHEHNQLVAFLIVENAEQTIDFSSFRKKLNKWLPDYMIPTHFIILDNFPLTLNKKINRNVLSNEQLSVIKEQYHSPKSPNENIKKLTVQPPENKTATNKSSHNRLEAELVELISQVLNITTAEIAVNKNIGEYGFDSILFTKFSTLINEKYSIDINPTLFYQYSTLEKIIQYLVEKYPKIACANNETDEHTETYEKNDHIIYDKPEQVTDKFDNEPIAIIGISGKFPESENLEIFWNNLEQGKNLVNQIPLDRWDANLFLNNDPEGVGLNSNLGGFLNDVDKFDPEIFGISPREAELMDPQQRLFLEVVWHLLENGGYTPQQLSQLRCGVFVGVSGSEYAELVGSNINNLDSHAVTGLARNIIANRISYVFNLSGPSAIIDTACSSSLVALHRAVISIRNGECDCAIAGGVNLILSPVAYIALSQNHMISKDGKCKTFDKDADGYVRGEGVGAVLLKPYSKAIKDKDHIYAVIRGSSENHGGHSNSLTAPNPNAQIELVTNAIKKSEINPETISYVETHGTGTSLGDPIEVNALIDAFKSFKKDETKSYKEKINCGLGSIKTNIGHLESAAGIASFLKVILAMQYKKIPATLHFNSLNPYINLDNSPFYIVDKTIDWKVLEDENGKIVPRRAGVSSFGMGGANSHVIVEENISHFSPHDAYHNSPQIFVISAKNEERLKEYAKSFINFLDDLDKYQEAYRGKITLLNIAYTMQTARVHMEERLALVVDSLETLKSSLVRFWNEEENIPSLYNANIKKDKIKSTDLFDESLFEDVLRVMYDRKDYDKIAQFWTSGINIDWKIVHQNKKFEKLPLPVYPFSKTRFWVKDKPSMPQISNSQNSYHILIDRIVPKLNFSSNIVFEKQLSSNMPILSDHIVQDKCIFPGVGYLELAYATHSIVNPDRDFNLMNVVILNPLPVSAAGQKIHIVLSKERESIKFEVVSIQNDKNIIHAKGAFKINANENKDKILTVSIDDIKNECTQYIEKKDLYQAFKERGITYGKYFQGIMSISSNDTLALGQYKLPTEFLKDLDLFHLSPTIMDASLQTIAGLFLNSSQKKILLPYAIDELELIKPIEPEGYIYTSLIGKNRFDVAILNKKGEICIKLHSVMLRKPKSSIDSLCYIPQWKLQSLPHEKMIDIHPGNKTVLIIYSKDGKTIANHIEKMYQNGDVYKIGLYNKKNNKNTKNLFVQSDNIQVIENFIKNMPQVDTIYFMGGLLSKEFSFDKDFKNKNMYKNSGLLLYHLMKIFDNNNLLKNSVQLKVITNNVVQIGTEKVFNPYAALCYGFLSSVVKEFTGLTSSVIDIDLLELKNKSADYIDDVIIKPILSEATDNNNSLIVYREQRRYIRKIHSIQLAPSPDFPFKEGGTYLLLGGAGGIGLELCLYISQKVKCNLILIGKSTLNEKRKSKITEIENNGCNVFYIQADASNLHEIKEAVGKGESQFGTINGVIHTALVLKDKTLKNMDLENFLSVLNPKVDGSINLYKAVKHLPLDFMLFFSSVQSFTSNAGQSNYAAACTFKDAFAHYIQQYHNYPIKIINWGFWNKVGVVSGEEYNKILNSRGVIPIDPKDGMEIIIRTLNNSAKQIIPFKAKGFVLDNLGFQQKSKLLATSRKIPQINHKSLLKSNKNPYNIEKIESLQNGFFEIENFSRFLVFSVFFKQNLFTQSNQQFTKKTLSEKFNVISNYHKLFDEMLQILYREGYIHIDKDMITTTNKITTDVKTIGHLDETIVNLKESLLKKHPKLTPWINILMICYEHYSDIISGKTSHMNVLFPAGSMSLVEKLYEGNEIIDHYNKSVASMVKNYIKERITVDPNTPIKILEIGSGTGGTSKHVLKEIDQYGDHIHYLYTDISPGFTKYGEKEYGSKYQFVQTRVLDIEKNIKEQGFDYSDFEIIFASNVLHATSNMENTINNVKKLLMKDGMVIINEATERQDFVTFVFGLTDGWWYYNDDYYRIDGSPLISLKHWKDLLIHNGFHTINEFKPEFDENTNSSQYIIVAMSDGLVIEEEKSDTISQTTVKQTIKKQSVSVKSKVKTKEMSFANNKSLDEKMIHYLKTIFSQVLRLNIEKLDIEETFETYGVDSLINIELNNKFENDFGPLPATLLFEYMTIDSLAKYFIDEHKETVEKLLNDDDDDHDDDNHDDTDDDYDENFKEAQSENDITFDYKNLHDYEDDSKITRNEQEEKKSFDIAVIGVSGRYPEAENLDIFWNNLENGENCIREVPQSRWNWKDYYSPDNMGPEKMSTKWAGFIEDVDKFDPQFFKITPIEAETMDPQERVFLETVWHTLEDAGYKRNDFKKPGGNNVGVFVGVMNGNYEFIGGEAWANGIVSRAHSSYWQIANRISYYFNFYGPSLAVDTACSSSLTAIHLACQSLKSGECNMAIAGGVNLILHPMHLIRLSNMNMLSSDDKCKSFGENADGFVDGEGVGAVLLKPLDEAIKDNDIIYGVIKGSSMNAGGKTSGFTVPNPNAQKDLIIKAIEQAEIDPRTISYIEAHGTGTALGDPIELTGLTKAFKNYTDDNNFCAIGSLKSNIGHLESAAGVSSLTKVLLQMKHKKLVPSINAENLNSKINFEKTPFYIQRTLEDWKRPVLTINNETKTVLRRAGISAFGAGGANVHVIMEEYADTNNNEQPIQRSDFPEIITLSTQSETQLIESAKSLKHCITNNKDISLTDIAYTLQNCREPMEYRLAIIAENNDELNHKLQMFIGNNYNDNGIFIRKSNPTINEEASLNNSWDNLSNMAIAWVNGNKIDWSILWQSRSAGKISLPGYPFLKERYWSPSNDDTVLKVKKSEPLHPLVYQNVSTFKEQKFLSILDNNEYLLTDHVIDDKKIIPGALYLEIARAAAEIAGEKNVAEIKNITWNKTYIVNDNDTETKLLTKLFIENNDILWEIEDEKSNLVYSQGSLVFEEGEKYSHDTIDIKKHIDQSIKTIHKESIYAFFNKYTMKYGEAYQCLKEIYILDNNEAVSFCKLPENVKSEIDKYHLHPLLLDGAFQTVTGTIINHFSNSTSNSIFVPFSIESIKVFTKMPTECYVHVQLLDKESSTDFLRFNITITNAHGEIVVTISNFIIKALSPGNNAGTLMYLNKEWEISNPKVNNSLSASPILVFENDGRFGKRLKSDLSDTPIIVVQPGKQFKEYDNNRFEINPVNLDDFHSLLERLTELNIFPKSIIYCNSLFVNPLSLSDQDILETNVYSLFNLNKAIMKQKINKNIDIFVFYNTNNTFEPFMSAISGFSKSLMVEKNEITIKTIGLPSDNYLIENHNKLIQELSFIDNSKEIVYEKGKRYYSRLKEIEVKPEINPPTPLKQNGIYIITGGMGKLGLHFTEYLAKSVDANIIITGRSPLDSYKQDQLEKLNTFNSQVEYIQSDVSKENDVIQLLENVREKYGKIDGIIHSAGIINDSLLINKTLDEFNNVISSKVYGTIFLDKYTADDNLDFFMIFSSIASVLGNVGQTDYAYANSFINNFIKNREKKRLSLKRNGKSIAICWPLWEDGGMNVDTQTREWMKNFAGILPMNATLGFESFNNAFHLSTPVLIILHGIKNKVLHTLISPQENTTDVSIDTKAIDSDVNNELLQKTCVFLQEVIAKEVKLSISKLKIDKTFDNFGFDSIITIGLIRKLEESFGVLPKTLFFEYNSINELARYFVNNHLNKLTEKLGHKLKSTRPTDNNEVLDKVVKLDKKRFYSNPRESLSNNDYSHNNESDNDYAIIGIAGQYPQADTLDEFWENLKQGKDCIEEIPSDRWDYKKYFDADKDKFGKTYSKWGGFINDVDKFDPLFFNISPNEAKFMDPQERLFLQTVHQTIEDSCYTSQELNAKNIGVFVGAMYGHYQLFGYQDNGHHIVPNSSFASIANRISYFFNFTGPSISLDTMCSSSLVAIHLACQSIKNKECELAIAGGVNLNLHPYKYIQLSQGRFASSDGKCRSFGEGGDGYVPGEGVGAVLIKPKKSAIKDGDKIYAIIKASAVSHGGKTYGYTVPNPNAQAELIKNTLQKANINPETINYIEAHGTGTALGDPIEIQGLMNAFGSSNKKNYCAIGSVKSNIGHLESAAGIAALTKLILQMKHKKLVPSIHTENINPNINIDNSPFYIQKKFDNWPQLPVSENSKQYLPRRAGISAFGAGGTNVHIILEEHNDLIKRNDDTNNDQENTDLNLFVLSAKNLQRLHEYSKTYRDFISKIIENNKNGNSLSLLNNKEKIIHFIKKDLISTISEILGFEIDEMHLKEDFKSLGFDNFTMITFIKKINTIYKITLKIDQLYDFKSINTLITYLIVNCKALLLHMYNIDNYALDENSVELPTLKELTYNMQLHRDHMDIRLAIICRDYKTLYTELNNYEKGIQSDNCFIINKAENSLIENFYSDNLGKDLINLIIQQKDFKKVAQLWVNGINIQWTELYNNSPIRKFSLPTYPFEKKRYWVPGLDNNDIVHQQNPQNNNNNYETKHDAPKKLDKELDRKHFISNALTETLGIDMQDLDDDKSFDNYGLDSVSSMKFVNKLKEHYPDNIDIDAIYTYSTINKLNDFLKKESKKEASNPERDVTKPKTVITPLKSPGLKTQNILINGVTGVLGSNLVKQLIKKTESKIFCLIRAESEKHAFERLEEMVKVYDPDHKLNHLLKSRIIPVLGDITDQNLGLEKKKYKELQEKIDLVIHNAGKTSLYGKFDEIKKVNIDGTKNMINFTLRTKQKYLLFVSTYAIMGDRQYYNCEPFTEADYDLSQSFPNLGYAKSKFIAEGLVRDAYKKGLKWLIVRPGNIMGESQTGHYPLNTQLNPGIFYDMFKTAIEMKVTADSSHYYDITPVDYVSKSIVYLCTQLKEMYRTYHLVNPDRKTYKDIITIFNKTGYSIDLVSHDKLVQTIKTASNPYNSITTDIYLLNSDIPRPKGFSYPDASYTSGLLEKADITCPKIDENLISTYMDYCLKIGYINKKTIKNKIEKIK